MILPPRPLAPSAVKAFATMVERLQIADEDGTQLASGRAEELTVRPITGQAAEQCRVGKMVELRITEINPIFFCVCLKFETMRILR